MLKNKKIIVQGSPIKIILNSSKEDFISLTDIAKSKNAEFPADVIKNWLRARYTIEFIGIWEMLHNPNFKVVDFDQFKNQLNKIAITQMRSLLASRSLKKLTSKNGQK